MKEGIFNSKLFSMQFLSPTFRFKTNLKNEYFKDCFKFCVGNIIYLILKYLEIKIVVFCQLFKLQEIHV